MNKYIKLSFAVLLSIVGVYFAFAGEDFAKLRTHITSVSLEEIYIAVILLIFSCLPRALRWKLLINPFKSIPFHHVFSATMIGYFGNGVLVFRLGELLKAYVIAKGRQITTSRVFGTVIVERILDLLMVFLIFIIVLPWFPLSDEKIKYGIYLSIVIFVFVILMIAFTYKFKLLDRFAMYEVFLTDYGKKIIKTLKGSLEGVVAVLKNENVVLIIFLSIFIWFIYFFVGLFVLKACDISLDFHEIGILLVISSFLLGIPSLPGAAGTLDVGVKYTLVLIFNVTSSKALSYSIISHAVAYFPLLIIGLIYFFTSNVTFQEIKNRKIINEEI